MKRALFAGVAACAALGAGTVFAVTAGAATTSYEAEAATLAGGALIATCEACSGEQKVGYVGDGSGTLTFTDVLADVAGPATLTIAYTGGTPRGAELQVNDAAATTLSFPATGGWGTPGTIEVPVTLVAGANTLTFGNNDGWAPDFDRLTVTTAGPASPAPTDAASPSPTGSAPVTASPSAPVTVAPTVPPSAAPTRDELLEAEVVSLINAERARVGCGPLAVNGRLIAAARAHSVYMANTGDFAHTTRGGVTFSDRISAADYRYSSAAENIAWGYTTAQAVVRGWINSPGHLQNIHTCGYSETGVGVASSGPNEPLYWTQLFASPLTSPRGA
ncbi:MAG TPA: CAP domain-containing protein [Micromonosporaceae bacterium]|nr:CAP domain-containing protein [Micromonosporaceae bacterium]